MSWFMSSRQSGAQKRVFAMWAPTSVTPKLTLKLPLFQNTEKMVENDYIDLFFFFFLFPINVPILFSSTNFKIKNQYLELNKLKPSLSGDRRWKNAPQKLPQNPRLSKPFVDSANQILSPRCHTNLPCDRLFFCTNCPTLRKIEMSSFSFRLNFHFQLKFQRR